MSILLLFPVLLPLVAGACVCFVPQFEDAKLRKIVTIAVLCATLVLLIPVFFAGEATLTLFTLSDNLPIFLHTGDERYDMSNPNRLKPILEDHPDLTVIAAHLGGYTVWEDAARELRGYENLYVDASSSLAFLTSERAREIILAFGTDRVLWGTDYPMWKFADEVKLFEALGLEDEDKVKIYYKNAQKLFGVTLKSV